MNIGDLKVALGEVGAATAVVAVAGAAVGAREDVAERRLFDADHHVAAATARPTLLLAAAAQAEHVLARNLQGRKRR